jgi:CRP-like cAMP-binding protein
VRLAEIGVTLGPSALLGEIGVFAPDNRRTGTAICETEVEIGAISDEKVLQLYYQNPTFGLHLFRLVVRRMLENERRQRSESASVSRSGPGETANDRLPLAPQAGPTNPM